MRILFIASLFLGLARPLVAADQLVTVTPQSLQNWKILGVDRDQLAKAKQLVLSNNAQLSRLFPGGAVVFRLVSRPVFSEESAKWPIIGVGPMALALVKKDGLGRLVLVTDEATAHDLPWSVPLDWSEDAVNLIVAYDPLSGAGLVGFQDKLQEFAVPVSVKPVEVWLGAGEDSSWPLDQMEVLLLGADTPESDKLGSGANSPQKAFKDRLQSVLLSERLAAGNPGGGSGYGFGSSVDSDGVAATTEAPVSKLEIFTPPSVRRAKVIDIVRAAVVQKGKK